MERDWRLPLLVVENNCKLPSGLTLEGKLEAFLILTAIMFSLRIIASPVAITNLTFCFDMHGILFHAVFCKVSECIIERKMCEHVTSMPMSVCYYLFI